MYNSDPTHSTDLNLKHEDFAQSSVLVEDRRIELTLKIRMKRKGPFLTCAPHFFIPQGFDYSGEITLVSSNREDFKKASNKLFDLIEKGYIFDVTMRVR